MALKEDLFYSDYRMVASTDSGCLQSVFDTLTGLFGWVGMRTSVFKTVGAVCKPCLAARQPGYGQTRPTHSV